MRAPLLFAFLLAFLSCALSHAALAVEDDFATSLSASSWTVGTPLRGASVTAPVADAQAHDGQACQLLYPGGTLPTRSGPRYGTELETTGLHGYGAYESRFKTVATSSSEGMISAFFTYCNDGADHDGDGVVDNSEIDLEFPSAQPSMVYMTVWTDYQYVDGVETFYKTTRKIDLATGRTWDTPPGGNDTYELEEVAPQSWSIPGFQASADYHTWGFDWEPTQIAFWIDAEDGHGPRTLWTFQGQPDSSLPALPAYTMFILDHNANDWETGRKVKPPAKAVSLWVDRVQYP